MNKQKNIPELRFPEFANEGKWEKKRIDDIANIVASGDLDYSSFSLEPTETHIYPVYSNSVSKEGLYGYNNYHNFKPNSVTITARGTLGVAFVRKTEFIGIGRLLVVSDLNNTDAVFLKENWNHFAKIPLENGGIPQLTAVKAKSVTLLFPKEKEQQKIASCLSSLDELIATHNQKLDLLKDHKKGLMQNLFPQEGEKVPKYRFPGFEKGDNWEEEKLGDIAENLDSKRVPITSNQREKGYIPYYGASGIIDYVKDYIFDEKLLCISEDGANLVDRNYPIAFSISGKTWVNNHAHVLRFASYHTQMLVENYINCINIQDFLTGMAQPKLNRGKLDTLPIPLPKNPNEQKKIAGCLSSLDALITAQTEKIQQLKQHKKGLMQGLFPKAID